MANRASARIVALLGHRTSPARLDPTPSPKGDHMTAAQVLIVEDDEMIADVVRISLSLDGYNVAHVSDGVGALSTMAASRPDVVILDLMLPHIGGWEVLSQMRADPHTADIPVIVMTAKTMPADEIRSYNLGASAYIRKPFLPQEMLDKVGQLVRDGMLVSPRSPRQPARVGPPRY
jgi:DNA-binding response OmpR family regulator